MSRLDHANQLLMNPVFKEVLEKIWLSIESEQLNCDTTDISLCQRLIIEKKQLGLLERNIHAIISDEKARVKHEQMKQDKPLDPLIEWGKR